MIRVPLLVRPPAAFSHRHDVRVVFGDTDAAGIVYYANYLRWFEGGRAELMRAAGVPYAEIVADGTFLPVVEAWCRYRAPARYDELLTVTSWVHEARSASLLVAHQIHRGDDLLAEGAARLACVTSAGGPQRLPQRLRRFESAT